MLSGSDRHEPIPQSSFAIFTELIMPFENMHKEEGAGVHMALCKTKEDDSKFMTTAVNSHLSFSP